LTLPPLSLASLRERDLPCGVRLTTPQGEGEGITQGCFQKKRIEQKPKTRTPKWFY